MSNPPAIIGLIGPMGVGKSTIAEALRLVSAGQRYSFATPIRNMLSALGVKPEYHTEGKNRPISWLHGKTSRELLRSLGTAWGRNMVGSDIWVNAVLLHAAKCTEPAIIIDDVRFDNEAAAIVKAGGTLVYLMREDVSYNYEHPTEQGLRDWSPVQLVLNMHSGNVIDAVYDPALKLFPRRPWWARLPRFMRSWFRPSGTLDQPLTLKSPDYCAQRLWQSISIAASFNQSTSSLG